MKFTKLKSGQKNPSKKSTNVTKRWPNIVINHTTSQTPLERAK